MEIERKFLLRHLPKLPLDSHCLSIEQGYLNTKPVLRIRRSDDDYYFTYKSVGLMAREEIEFPLDKTSYLHLREKCDGTLISKRRYVFVDHRPAEERFTKEFLERFKDKDHSETFHPCTIELDVFEGELEGLILTEVEFENEDFANNYLAPDWFTLEVTQDPTFHNSNMSTVPAAKTLAASKALLKKD